MRESALLKSPGASPALAPHILIVEDDRFVRDVLEIYLSNEGYQVVTAANGDEMRDRIAQYPIALVLMDVKLPGEDGFTLTRELRKHHHFGIIILTTRHETIDRVVGLECGADDYVIKPFEEREVLARIRSVLRRTAGRDESARAATQAHGAARIVFHGCALDPDSATFRGTDGRDQPLTENECRLLTHLVSVAGQVQSREQLTEAVLRRPWSPLDRSIDVLITRLRQKIESDPKRPTIIKTARGVGYVVTESRSASER